MALERLVLVGRDEGEHAVVGGVRGAVGYPRDRQTHVRNAQHVYAYGECISLHTCISRPPSSSRPWPSLACECLAAR